MRFPTGNRAWALPILAALAAPGPAQTAAPPATRLELDAPVATWDEAIPLGNGLMGGLLWGEGDTVRLSLDRGDLWDERRPEVTEGEDWTWNTIRRLVAAGDQAEISRLFDAPYHEPFPTKLPGGRLELTLAAPATVERFTLDLARALGRVETTGGTIECFFSATEPVALLRVRGPAVSHRFLRPGGLDSLGYPPAAFGSAADATWMVQQAALGLEYAVVVRTRRVGEATVLAVAITSTSDGDDPRAVGLARTRRALDRGFDALRAEHERWWRDFWSTSAVHIPDARLQRHYDIVSYFYGAASRIGTPPMPLQALWTRDDGGLPPWKGDFHHDLNTQMTYLAYHTAGRVEAGRSFLDHQWNLLPTYRRFARDFYGVEGAAMPGVATLAGQPTGGWSQYALSPTNALWVGQSFYLHWRTTMDRAFLAERAYPWLSEIATGVVNLLDERDGGLFLPLSSSPEIHDNSRAAWLAPNSNFDQELMRWAFGALAEMADALGRADDAKRWRGLQIRVPPPHVADDGVLMFAAGEPFDASHRHHSHAMAIHPLGTLHIEGSETDRAIIDATLDRMEELGTQAWVGYSFSWFACLLARAGRGDEALRYLRDYERAFTLRNGFHVNGDQLGAGLSAFRYRPFTLEGNFLAMQAVHEMLLQSWGGRVRVFPATPSAWKDVSFARLRAEGGFVVSAARVAGRTRRVSITATVAAHLRLADPFAGAPFRGPRKVERAGDELRCELAAGETLVLAAQEEQAVGGERPTVSVAGTWRVRLDPEGAGEAERWFDEELAGDPIPLPGTTDLAGIGHPLDEETMRYAVPFLDSRWPGRDPSPRADEAGHLVRPHMYIGKAWYQRTIEVPDQWDGRRVQLLLERIVWASTVWVDGRLVGTCDSLVTPHRFDLGPLAPGPHRLTVRVDNGLVHDIGILGHAYGPETQSRWNGIVGRMELSAVPSVHLGAVQVFPGPDGRTVRVVASVTNAAPEARPGRLRLVVRGEEADEGAAAEIGATEIALSLAPGARSVEATVDLHGPVHHWSEFDPRRYVLTATLRSREERDEIRTPFGIRTLRRAGRRILLDGTPIFLRGTLDCAVYPRTGHPPLTVTEWLATLGTIRAYGFNHVRFHTWCPPEAAFEAADRLGMYLAPETPFWVDDWTAGLGPRPGRLGERDEVTRYVRDEIRRISEAYGNHPSFALFCIGNELGNGSDWELVNELLEEAKARDPRHLHTAATARRRVAADDFRVTHRTDRPVRGVGPDHTNWDFAAGVAAADLPVIAHETGQRPVFPDYGNLLPKFTGPLAPYDYARLRDAFVASGRADQGPAFTRASALFQIVQYKAEHEAFHRTADLAGYQLLMLNDFTGQSEALVGILDPFWEPKGIVGVRDVRRWNAPTVALARFARFTWTADEEFAAAIEVSHHGAEDLADVIAHWRLSAEDGSFTAAGDLPPRSVPRGALTRLGEMHVPLAGCARATALRFQVRVAGVENEWKLWVYPPAGPEPDPPPGILVASRLDDRTRRALAAGGSVLLLAHGAENQWARRTGFASVYWSAGWWGDAFSSLGILCDPAHPALADFPNDGHSDWQWFTLTQGATTFRLEGAPPGFLPIVQPVPDFHHPGLLAQVFEARVGPGRILVCGYDLERDLPSRPAARQFRRSLLEYMAGSDFAPPHALPPALLARWLQRPAAAPESQVTDDLLGGAPLHVRAAANLRVSNVSAPWIRSADLVVGCRSPYAWHVDGGTWRDARGTAWHGSPLEVTVEVPPATTGELLVHFHDWNELGRRGRIAVEGRTYTLGAHGGEGKWLAFPVTRVDTADGRLLLRAHATAGPNLMITELAFLPRE